MLFIEQLLELDPAYKGGAPGSAGWIVGKWVIFTLRSATFLTVYLQLSPGTMSDQQAVLKNIPIFTELDDQALSTVLSRARKLVFRKNTLLMSEGEPGQSMYVILSGAVKVFVADEDGAELTLFLEGPGSYIGEISLLDDSPRSASVTTIEKTEVLAISKDVFLDSIASHPEISFQIVRSMTRRLRWATDMVRSLALKNVYQRLALKLIELTEDEDGALVIPRKLSHQELANMIGSSREMVGKVLAELTKGGYIELKNQRICLLRTLPHDW